MKEKQIIKILMVEDIGLITEAYYRIISDLSTPDKSYFSKVAENCDDGWEEMNNQGFDLVVLDVNFPTRCFNKIKSGIELGQKIRMRFPKTKIIVLTGVRERKPLKKIIKEINPEGFLSKGETRSSEIVSCLETVLADGRYYGEFYSCLLGLKHS